MNPPSELRGAVILRPLRNENALYMAHRAAHRRPSTSRDGLALNIFCDASHEHRDNVGGYAVTYPPWIAAETPNNTLVEQAWPMYPLYDCNLGEFVAIAESLATAIQQIKSHRETLKGKEITITVFNDSDTALKILAGAGSRKKLGLWALWEPVVKLIERQSQILACLGPKIYLQFRWMPGHFHRVLPHVRADALSKYARKSQRSYHQGVWKAYSESPTMRWLKKDLTKAAGRCIPYRITHAPIRASTNPTWQTALQRHLISHYPITTIGSQNMQIFFSNTEQSSSGAGTPTLKTQVGRQIFINDGINGFFLQINDPEHPCIKEVEESKAV